jgi:hypothetical protein
MQSNTQTNRKLSFVQLLSVRETQKICKEISSQAVEEYVKYIWSTHNPNVQTEIYYAKELIMSHGYNPEKIDYIYYNPHMFLNLDRLNDCRNPNLWLIDPYGYPIYCYAEPLFFTHTTNN